MQQIRVGFCMFQGPSGYIRLTCLVFKDGAVNGSSTSLLAQPPASQVRHAIIKIARVQYIKRKKNAFVWLLSETDYKIGLIAVQVRNFL